MAAAALVATLLLACAGSCLGHGSEVVVVARTEAALRAQEDYRAKAVAALNATVADEVEGKIRAVPGQVEASLRSRRTALEVQFDESRDTISRVARAAAAAARAPGKEAIQRALNQSDEAVADMWKASDGLDDLDAEQMRALRSGIRAAYVATIDQAREAKQLADRLEHVSHKVLDPLYGMGDTAEDRADAFNDQAVNAKDAVSKAANKLMSHIEENAEAVRESADEALRHDARERRRNARESAAKAARAAQQLVAAGAVGELALAGAVVGSSSTLPVMLGLAAVSAVAGAAAAVAVLKPWRSSRGSQPLLA